MAKFYSFSVKENTVPFDHLSHSLSLPLLAPHLIFWWITFSSVSVRSTISGSATEWDHTQHLSFCACLTSFSIKSSSSIHVVLGYLVSISDFFFQKNFGKEIVRNSQFLMERIRLESGWVSQDHPFINDLNTSRYWRLDLLVHFFWLHSQGIQVV
jgi:hypothetical protein